MGLEIPIMKLRWYNPNICLFAAFIFISFYFFHNPIFQWQILPTHFVFPLLLSFKSHLAYFSLYTYSKTFLFFYICFFLFYNSISDFRYSMTRFIFSFSPSYFIILLIRINLIGNHLWDFFHFPTRIEEIFVKECIFFHFQLLTSLVFSPPIISEVAVEPFHCISTFFLCVDFIYSSSFNTTIRNGRPLRGNVFIYNSFVMHTLSFILQTFLLFSTFVLFFIIFPTPFFQLSLLSIIRYLLEYNQPSNRPLPISPTNYPIHYKSQSTLYHWNQLKETDPWQWTTWERK